MSTVNDSLRKEPGLQVKWFLDKVRLSVFMDREEDAEKYEGKAAQGCCPLFVLSMGLGTDVDGS